MTNDQFNDAIDLFREMKPWMDLEISLMSRTPSTIFIDHGGRQIAIIDMEFKTQLQEIVRLKLKSFMEKSENL